MDRLYGLGIVVASLLFMSQPAQAAFEPTDWKVGGDALSTLHRDTGLEWLDLSMTLNMSVNQVVSELGAGGKFEGWRLPTEQEINKLMSSLFPYLGIEAGDVRYVQVGNIENLRSNEERLESAQFRSLFGLTGGSVGTSSQKWTARTLGFYSGAVGNMIAGAIRVNNAYPDKRELYYYNSYSQSSISLNTRAADTGVYLVSDGGITLSSKLDPSINKNNPNAPEPVSDVSAPALAGFGGLLCLMIAGFRRFRSR